MAQAQMQELAAKRMRNRKMRDQAAGWLFAAPAIIGFVVLTLLPMIFSLYWSEENATNLWNRIGTTKLSMREYCTFLKFLPNWTSSLLCLKCLKNISPTFMKLNIS